MVDMSVLNCLVYKNNQQAKRVGREGVIQALKKAQGPLVHGPGVWAPLNWDIGGLVVKEFSPMAAGGYNLRPFVQQSGWIHQGDHHFSERQTSHCRVPHLYGVGVGDPRHI